MNREELRVSKVICQKLVDHGAEAVVLFGSRARGDAYIESDFDIHAVGKGPHYRLELCQGFLVSVSWATSRQNLSYFRKPADVGWVVQGWRNAVVLHDPKGVAKALKQRAQKWRWESLGKLVDKWVAEELTGYAEEVHRLVGNLRLGRKHPAAVQRSVLAIRMAPILAAHHRILYDTENQLWDIVSERMGGEWAQLQRVALGEDDHCFDDVCKSALRLFTLTANEIRSLLDDRQYQVVANACEIAGQPLPYNKQHNVSKST